MIETTAADAFNALSSSERKQIIDWVQQLDLVHAEAIYGLITIRLAQFGVVSITGTVDLR